MIRPDRSSKPAWLPRPRHLRTRMRLWMVGISSLILIGLLLSNYLGFREHLTESAQRQARFVTADSVNRIDASLGIFQGAIDGIALVLERRLTEMDIQEIKELQRHTLDRFPGIYGIALGLSPERQPPGWDALAPYTYQDGGDVHYQDLGRDNQRYLGADWFALPRYLRRPVWTEPYICSSCIDPNTKMVTYSVPMYLANAEGRFFAGVVTCDIALPWLDQLIASLPLGENGYGLLMSRNGRYITHPREEIAFRESVFSIAEAQNNQGLRALGQDMISGRPGMVPWVSWATGDESWLAWDVLQTTGWTVATLVSQRALRAEVMRLMWLEAIAGAAGILVLIVAVNLIARSITQPISALSVAAPKLSAGDLDASLPTPRGNDEVAQLTRAFARMRDELKHYIADLKETTAARERIDGELRIAHDIQMDLVPKTFPVFPYRRDMDLYAIMEPAREVGGDFYDFLLLDEHHIMLAIADVSGKGIPAAMFMAVTRSLLRAEFKTNTDPGQALERVNDALAENNDSCMFVTLFCALVDLSTGVVKYANAGHNPPIWLHADGEPEWIDQPFGTAAGAMPEIRYETGRFVLGTGDALLFYTDGVNEAMDIDNREYGNQRLLEHQRGCRQLDCKLSLENLLADVHQHVGEAAQSDDITMMLFRRTTTADTPSIPSAAG